jgi:hypothetical protein
MTKKRESILRLSPSSPASTTGEDEAAGAIQACWAFARGLRRDRAHRAGSRAAVGRHMSEHVGVAHALGARRATIDHLDGTRMRECRETGGQET